MAKKTFQVRYPEPGLTEAESKARAVELISGRAFDGKFPIEKLGIQAVPGTKFYLNSSIKPVMIGATGIYELDLPNKVSISALRFDANSIHVISEADTAIKAGLGLLVDIVYKEG